MRLSGIMPRPKSYKSSINLFGKTKYDSALIDQKQQSIVGKKKSLRPHCFVTCLRNKVCVEELCGPENQRVARRTHCRPSPHPGNVRLC